MPVNTKNRFLLVYGSQTGQAQAISEEIAEKAEQYGLHADIHCLSLTEKKFNIEREKCVVIVTSTTGDGDPPDTARKFIRRLKKTTLSETYLSHLNYTLLGLGDSNYTNFCNCAKSLEKRLSELGAKQFYPSGWADDAVGLEVVVEPWMDGLFPAITKFLGLVPKTASNTASSLNSCKTCNNIILSNVSESKVTGVSSPTSEVCSQDLETDSLSSLPLSNTANSSAKSTSDENIIARPVLKTELMSHSKEETVSENHRVKKMEPSLKNSVPPLSESSLIMPILPPRFLSIIYKPEDSLNVTDIPIQNGCSFPSAASGIVMAEVTSAKQLTSPDALKKTLLLTLDLKDSSFQCKPGDAISVVCPNSLSEVQMLLTRLGLKEKAEVPVTFEILPNTKKRNASVPPYFPKQTTLQHLLQTCIDIRDPPKKALLRCLVDYTSNETEKRRLQELCSKQGAEDYGKFIRAPGLSILDVLSAFPSCTPSFEAVLEHLPRLQPRPYSICCDPSRTGKIQICFNVVSIEEADGRSYPRSGLCTGWLDRLTGVIQSDGSAEKGSEINEKLQSLTLTNPPLVHIPVFARTNQRFHSPEDTSKPMILIGPGTGVAPFIGFLQQRQSHLERGDKCGAVWLFYGCRHREKDFLFKKELLEFERKGTLTKFCLSVSREEDVPECTKYVQDCVLTHGESLVMLIDDDAVVYVCGDANNMAKDINAAFCSIIQKHKNLNESDALAFLMKMRLHKRYLEDVWI